MIFVIPRSYLFLHRSYGDEHICHKALCVCVCVRVCVSVCMSQNVT